MRTLSSWQKIRILVKRNLLTEKRSKLLLSLEILICFIILVILRQNKRIRMNTKQVFEPNEIGNLDNVRQHINKTLEWRFAYSPSNEPYDKLIQEVSKKLKLLEPIGFSNKKLLAAHLWNVDTFAGIEFDDDDIDLKSLPRRLKYSLRFPQELRTFRPTKKFGELLWQPIWPYRMHIDSGSPRFTKEDDGGPPGYIREGFVAIQQAIFLAYSHNLKPEYIPERIVLRRFPNSDIESRPYLPSNIRQVATLLLFCYMLPSIHLLRTIMQDKSDNFKEMVMIYSIRPWMHWAGYFLFGHLRLLLFNTIFALLLTTNTNRYIRSELFPYSDKIVLFMFLTLYGSAMLAMNFTIASVFDSSKCGCGFGILLWLITCTCSYVVTFDLHELQSYLVVIVLAFPNNCLIFGMIIAIYSEQNVGLQWWNIMSDDEFFESVKFSNILLALILSTILFTIVALVIENVKAGLHVDRDPIWPYIKNCVKKKPNNTNVNKKKHKKRYSTREGFLKNMTGILVNRLWKEIEKKKIIQHLSFKAYKGEITVVLGYKQSGKTTLIALLAGLLKPTDGTIHISGRNLANADTWPFSNIGICFKENILFGKLTVLEHLNLFSRIKGLEERHIAQDINFYKELFKFEDIQNMRVDTLNDGQRRMLALALAVCAGSNVILFDEPTYDLDPIWKKRIWNMISILKMERTILVTTNDVEEADKYADQILIIYGGVLKYSGYLFNIKRKLRLGYRITVFKDVNYDFEQLDELIKQFIPHYEIQNESIPNVTVTMEHLTNDQFRKFVTKLTESFATIGISRITLAAPTLADICIKLIKPNAALLKKPDLSTIRNYMVVKGHRLQDQFNGILLKKFVYAARSKLLILLIIFSVFLIKFYIELNRFNRTKLDEEVTIMLNLKSYDHKPVAVIEVNETVIGGTITNDLLRTYMEIVESRKGTCIHTGGRYIQKFFLDKYKEDETSVKTSYFCGISIKNNVITAWFNNQVLHVVPIALNLVHNSLLALNFGKEFTIEVINAPLKIAEYSKIGELASGNSNITLIIVMGTFMPLLTSHFIVFLVQEKVSKLQFLQFLTGVNIFVYWFVGFIFDFCLYSFYAMNFTAIMCLFSFNGREFLSVGLLVFVLICFGWAALSVTYLISKSFDCPNFAFYVSCSLKILSGLLLYDLKTSISSELSGIGLVLLLFPHYNLLDLFNRIYVENAKKKYCYAECDRLLPDYSICDEKVLCQMIEYCCGFGERAWFWEFEGIPTNLCFFAITSALSWALLIIAESNVMYSENYVERSNNVRISDVNEEINQRIQDEINRVKEVIQEDKTHNVNLIVDGVGIVTHGYCASASFTLSLRSCFAIYGPAKMGKSKFLDMILGLRAIPCGSIYIRRDNSYDNLYGIGYCPQFNCLMDDFTGSQLIRVFCLIRGVPFVAVGAHMKQLIIILQLQKLMAKPICMYSAVDQRKLCILIALLSGSSVVVLDEPTSGMDIGTSLQIWTAVNYMKRNNRAILLTTNNIRECEFVANQIGIFKDKAMKYLGTAQDLQAELQSGFIIEVRIRWYGSTVEEAYHTHRLNLQNISAFLENNFGPTTLLSENATFYKFSVQCKDLDWSMVFEKISKSKRSFRLDDYIISPISLNDLLYCDFEKYQVQRSLTSQQSSVFYY